ncbi:MAG: hypothetical protein C5B52_15045 [Bacteroidetes bacterium]|nr:MAG: hypothetical protein C5B52_15045 [Bacteroidota bacterium]
MTAMKSMICTRCTSAMLQHCDKSCNSNRNLSLDTESLLKQFCLVNLFKQKIKTSVMSTQKNGTVELTVNEKQLREGIMPRAQLSKAACEIALEKTQNKSVKQFAGWELMEATTVIKVLEDVGTKVTPITGDARTFLDHLESLEEKEFDKEYMQAELSNHEFLRDLAQQFIDGYDEELTGKQEIGHVSNLALFAFTEHIGLCKNIIAELS